jgi:hypothetical protein
LGLVREAVRFDEGAQSHLPVRGPQRAGCVPSVFAVTAWPG